MKTFCKLFLRNHRTQGTRTSKKRSSAKSQQPRASAFPVSVTANYTTSAYAKYTEAEGIEGGGGGGEGRTRGRSFKANQKSDSVTVLKEPERNCPAAFVPKTNAPGVGKNAVASPMSSGAALAKR
jgi:hypothetical protein